MNNTETRLIRGWIGKILLGEAPDYNIRATAEERLALAEAMYATQLFDKSLTSENATVESVMNALSRKHRAAKKFEKQFGVSWPL